MFDDLRKDANDDQSSFFQEDLADIEPLLSTKPKKASARLSINLNSKTFLGMNAFQRFVISALLLVVVCIMGVLLLMVTGSIAVF